MFDTWRGKEACRHRVPPASYRWRRPCRSPLRLEEADVSAAAPLIPPAVPLARRDGPSFPGAHALIEQARQGLLGAECAPHPVDRYAQAHLAALRAAAAVLATQAQPRRGARPTSAWVLLSMVAPEFAEWSVFFAATSATRAAAEAGVRRLVTTRDADDLVRQVGEFLSLVERTVSGTSR